MSAPRLARANRSRFFIGLAILILTMGFVAIFHSSQQQLDELRQMELRCEQQQESLHAQLLVFEKSLKSERHDHQQTKYELQRRSKEVKELRDKTLMESNMKFGALQQNYKLLKIQNEDLAEECAKKQAQNLEDQNAIEGKLKSNSNQNAQAIKEKLRVIEEQKVKIKQLENEMDKQRNNKQLKDVLNDEIAVAELQSINFKLQRELDQYRSHCSWRPDSNVETATESEYIKAHKQKSQEVHKNFNAQIAVSENLYKIPINIANHTSTTASINRMHKFRTKSVGVGDKTEGAIKMATKDAEQGGTSKNSDAIIISVENFQFVPKPLMENAIDKEVLPEPPPVENFQQSSSTMSSNKKTSLDTARADANNLQNAPLPTATPSSKLKISSTTATNKKQEPKTKVRQVPEGVVPLPPHTAEEIINEDASEQQNNRYSNVVDEIDSAKKTVAESDKKALAEGAVADIGNLHQGNDIDNGAHEIMDNNDFLVDDRNHKDHLQAVLDDNKLNGNNAAEEDTNLFDKTFNLAKPNVNSNINDDDMVVPGGGKDDDLHDSNNRLANNKKLMNEIDGDQGKVAAYPDDMHMEEQLDEDDDDDYANPSARKQDPAVRN